MVCLGYFLNKTINLLKNILENMNIKYLVLMYINISIMSLQTIMNGMHSSKNIHYKKIKNIILR